MAKTLANLTDAEFAIVNEYVEMFGISENEALAQALSEGSISDNDGGNFKYKPEGFHELKLYRLDTKSTLFKLNKALKTAKKPELFEEDCWYYNIDIAKTEDKKDFDLDKCSAVKVEGTPRVIVNKIAYKATRAIFDGQRKPLPTNFETTLANSVFPDDQKQMLLLKGEGNAYSVIQDLKKEYHDGKQGKTQEKVPDILKCKFKVVLFGLVEIDGKWEKFFMELTNKYDDKDSLTSIYNKEATGVKTRWISEVQITGQDSFENPTIQLQPVEQMEVDTFKALAPVINETTRDVLTFITEQVAYAKGAATKAKDSGKTAATSTEDEDGENDPFSE